MVNDDVFSSTQQNRYNVPTFIFLNISLLMDVFATAEIK